MRYLVTGANGGLGGMVRDLLIAAGNDVHQWAYNVQPEFEGNQFDGIFHAAGKEAITPLRDCGLAEFDLQMAAPWMLSYMLRHAQRNGVKNGGSIVAMSSVAAVCGAPGMSLYAASKGAIESMVRSAAVELAGRKIRVNAIRAGAFTSPMHDRITQRLTPPQVDDYRGKHPLGFGTCEDVAKLAVAMLTGYDWMTGSIITMDGGYSAK